MHRRILNIPGKMKGSLRAEQAPLSLKYAVWGLISGFLSIYAMFLIASQSGYPILIAPFGASAVLLFGVSESPLAQPRNLLGGHVVSALIAIAINALGCSGPFATALAVGLALFCMYLTRTIHPPGGATAFIGVQGHAGLSFLFIPVLSGVAILLLMALFMNNVVHHRQYPKHWL
jgi:CBS-domain-containing membrane protein